MLYIFSFVSLVYILAVFSFCFMFSLCGAKVLGSSRFLSKVRSFLAVSLVLVLGSGFLIAVNAKPVFAADPPRTVLDSQFVWPQLSLINGKLQWNVVHTDFNSPNPDHANVTSYQTYGMDDVVIHIDNAKKVTVPSVGGWDYLAPVGSEVWETAKPVKNRTDSLAMQISTFGVKADDLDYPSRARVVTLREFSGPGDFLFTKDSIRAGKSFTNAANTLDSFDHVGEDAQKVEFKGSALSFSSWYFSHSGVYCIGFGAETVLKDKSQVVSPTGTLRIAVGDVADPATAPCDQGSGSGYVPPGKDLMDPVHNQLVDWRHADIAAYLTTYGGFRMGIHWAGTQRQDFANTILLIPDAAKETVPPPVAPYDDTFIAPAGTDFWRAPQHPANNYKGAKPTDKGIPWFGFSSEHIEDAWFERLVNWNLYAVTGIDGGAAPGDFILNGEHPDVRRGEESPIFTTRRPLPQSYQMIPRAWAHLHGSWDFTAPGIYCLHMGMSDRLADSTPVADIDVFTIVVGGEHATFDPKAMQTCKQAGVSLAYGVPQVADPIQAPRGDSPVVVKPKRPGGNSLVPTIKDGQLHVGYLVEDQAGSGKMYDPEDVLVHRTLGNNRVFTDTAVTKRYRTGKFGSR